MTSAWDTKGTGHDNVPFMRVTSDIRDGDDNAMWWSRSSLANLCRPPP